MIDASGGSFSVAGVHLCILRTWEFLDIFLSFPSELNG